MCGCDGPTGSRHAVSGSHRDAVALACLASAGSGCGAALQGSSKNQPMNKRAANPTSPAGPQLEVGADQPSRTAQQASSQQIDGDQTPPAGLEQEAGADQRIVWVQQVAKHRVEDGHVKGALQGGRGEQWTSAQLAGWVTTSPTRR